MSRLKLWLNISPFIPIIGIFLTLYQVDKYNHKCPELENFGIWKTNSMALIAALFQSICVCSLGAYTLMYLKLYIL